MSEPLYLSLKRTTITTAGIIFSALITYSLAVKNTLLSQYLVVALVALVIGIYLAYVLEVREHKKLMSVKRG